MKQFNSQLAYDYLMQAEKMNSGPWISHSIYAAKAAKNIAEKLYGMDPDLAEAYGYIHDIGRRYGIVKMKHVIEGYRFLEAEGYPEAAKICMTHSFPTKKAEDVIGAWDCSEEDSLYIEKFIDSVEYSPYDELIQLCDVLALPTGFTVLERRLIDIGIRYGVNDGTVRRWKAYLILQDKIEKKLGYSIYELMPGIEENLLKSPLAQSMKFTLNALYR